MNKKKLIVVLFFLMTFSFLVVVLANTYFFKASQEKPNSNNSSEPHLSGHVDVLKTNNFNINIIREVNAYEKENTNFLISPYSIEIAFNMLKEGSAGKTYEELEKVFPKRNINFLYVKNRINVADALFIKDKYKNMIKKDFINTVKEKYISEVLFEKFETPEVINNWVNDKTDGMIEKVVDDISNEFVLAIANAIAIDVDWKYNFECVDTIEADFTNGDKIIKVEMMNKIFNSSFDDVKYINTDEEIGIVLPYKSYKSDGSIVEESSNETTDLEFIAILPKDIKNLNNYLTEEKYNTFLKNAKNIVENEKLKLSIPRFSYDYDFKEFYESLYDMGLKNTLSNEANFSKISDISLTIGKLIHKAHISLNEKGTRAAAVTYIPLYENAVAPIGKNIEIAFNKPFIYMIRDKKGGELLFFGKIVEPNIWQGSTCKIK